MGCLFSISLSVDGNGRKPMRMKSSCTSACMALVKVRLGGRLMSVLQKMEFPPTVMKLPKIPHKIGCLLIPSLVLSACPVYTTAFREILVFSDNNVCDLVPVAKCKMQCPERLYSCTAALYCICTTWRILRACMYLLTCMQVACLPTCLLAGRSRHRKIHVIDRTCIVGWAGFQVMLYSLTCRLVRGGTAFYYYLEHNSNCPVVPCASLRV